MAHHPHLAGRLRVLLLDPAVAAGHINSLEDQKQTSKLNVFLKLRNIIVAVVVLSTIYNIGFSYMVATKLIESQWKYQWFFNDGIWSLFYCLIIVVIMVSEGMGTED